MVMNLVNGTYRLTWEIVNLKELWRYNNADPMVYSNTTQTVPNSEIPDEHWHTVGPVEFTIPGDKGRVDQYKTLVAWDQSDRQFVRRVKLERRVDDPTWEGVKS